MVTSLSSNRAAPVIQRCTLARICLSVIISIKIKNYVASKESARHLSAFSLNRSLFFPFIPGQQQEELLRNRSRSFYIKKTSHLGQRDGAGPQLSLLTTDLPDLEGCRMGCWNKKSSHVFWSDQTGGRNPGTLACLFVCFLVRVLFIFDSHEAEGLMVRILTEAKRSVRADAFQASPYGLANSSQSSSGLPHFSVFVTLFISQS